MPIPNYRPIKVGGLLQNVFHLFSNSWNNVVHPFNNFKGVILPYLSMWLVQWLVPRSKSWEEMAKQKHVGDVMKMSNIDMTFISK